MHELAVSQSLLREVQRVARAHAAVSVSRVLVQIGPLSGVEPSLLREAFPLAAAGTLAERAELVIETVPLRVRCETCGAESEARPNRLLCGACGGWHTRLLSGDELLLASVELQRQTEEARHV